MYNVGDIIQYVHPFREDILTGKIIAIHKVLKSTMSNLEGTLIYLVEYDPRCTEDFVYEEQIIVKTKEESTYEEF